MFSRFFNTVLLIFCLLPWSVKAFEPLSPLEYLNRMTEAHRTLNYELIYLLQEGEDAISWRYRHAQADDRHYAQLLKLDEVRQEMILQHDKVGYFGNFLPFSLNADRILDNLPSVLYTDFNRLQGYSLVDLGRSRIANRVAHVIRISPNDDFRYQYRLWIDEENYLLLKSELLDRDQNVLESFRVLRSIIDDELQEIILPISALTLPESQAVTDHSESQLNWQPKWLPKGFALQTAGKSNMMAFSATSPVESRFYSDGLFSFTIYIADNQGQRFEEQFWREGKTSIYSQTVGDKDIIIIGEIPIVSARHILQEIEFISPLVREERNAH